MKLHISWTIRCAIIFFIWLLSQYDVQGQCPAYPPKIVEKQGFRLYGHVIFSLYAEKEVLCRLRCNIMLKCLTFNYNSTTEICELNDADDSNDDLQPSEGFVYVDVKKQKKSKDASTTIAPTATSSRNIDSTSTGPTTSTTQPTQTSTTQVDGDFTEWGSWTSCSLSCGNGTRHRNRSCSNPPPANGGKNCAEPHNETRTCNTQPCFVLKNCTGFYKHGYIQSGVYTINPDGQGTFNVYCDQQREGGGWTVFQRRKDGSVDFYRGWNDYKKGFGDLEGEFWLGLEKIYRLTKQSQNRLRVELDDWKGNSSYAEYDLFAVGSESEKFTLSLGTYSGTTGDSLSLHHGMAFSTKDRDNDNLSPDGRDKENLSSDNCAVEYKGAWWYNSCHTSNLNGLYHHGKHESFADGVNWDKWKGYHYSAKRSEMKIRPV